MPGRVNPITGTRRYSHPHRRRCTHRRARKSRRRNSDSAYPTWNIAASGPQAKNVTAHIAAEPPMRSRSSPWSTTLAPNPDSSEMTTAPAAHEPRSVPSPAARYGNTGRKAHAFSATPPCGVSGSCDGYPLTAAYQYHWASQPSASSPSDGDTP